MNCDDCDVLLSGGCQPGCPQYMEKLLYKNSQEKNFQLLPAPREPILDWAYDPLIDPRLILSTTITSERVWSTAAGALHTAGFAMQSPSVWTLFDNPCAVIDRASQDEVEMTWRILARASKLSRSGVQEVDKYGYEVLVSLGTTLLLGAPRVGVLVYREGNKTRRTPGMTHTVHKANVEGFWQIFYNAKLMSLRRQAI